VSRLKPVTNDRLLCTGFSISNRSFVDVGCVLFVFGVTAIPPLPPVGHGILILEVSRSHTTRSTVDRTPLDE
jgi:hypothetical protein